MPRRPRRDDVTSTATEDAAQTNASLANDDHPDQLAPLTNAAPLLNQQSEQPASDSPSNEAASKPRTRRPRRPARATADIAPTEAPVGGDSQSSPSDSAANAASGDGKPRRRGGRRPQSSEAANLAAVSQDAVNDGGDEIDIAAQVDSNAASIAETHRRRQVGGRRSASQAVEAINSDFTLDSTGPPADVETDGSVSETTPRSRRNRRGGSRRRRSQGSAVEGETIDAEEAVEEIVVEASIEDESADSAGTEPNDGPRSRRSRRGGRRRSKGEGVIDPETGEMALVAVAETLDELALPTPHVRERYSVPSLVPNIAELGLPRIDLGIVASVDASIPAFIINGQRYTPHLCFVNAEGGETAGDNAEVVSRQISRAASAGVHLHTAVAYLPLKNAYGERSMDALDSALRTIITADPEGFIALRVQCAPTNFWVRTHADQMVQYQDGSEGDVTIASNEFWADCVDALSAMLEHLAQPDSPGHGRVFALHLDKGEWFYEPGTGFDYSAPNQASYQNWLHERYQAEYALRASWLDNKVSFETAVVPVWENNKDKHEESVLNDRKQDRAKVDYALYTSSVVGNVICGLASAVKDLTAGNLLVFVPYGYIFEFATRSDSGHNALGQVLDCRSVDVLTGPNSYGSRAAGGVGGFAAPVDSVLLHNKIWLVEDDTKTYLAPDDTSDTYNPKVPTAQETVMVHRRNFFAALAHGCGLTWMDLWGQGWLDSDTVWEEFHDMIAAAQRFQAVSGPIMPSPEAAIIVDEASYAWVRSDSGGSQLQNGLIVKARDLLLRSGASVGFYLQSDVDKLPDSVKIVVFLNALRVSTDERQAIRERLQRPGITLAWLYAPGLYDENGVAPSEVTEIVGMALKPQQWSSRIGTMFTEERHVVIERLHGGKRMGTADILNPSYTVVDPQATVLGEYAQSGNPSIAAKVLEGGWKSIFIGEPHLTGELIRGMFRYSGVHLYDVQDDIVYTRGDGTLLIHAPYSGQRVIYLPRQAACYSVFEGRLITQSSSSVRVFMRGRSTHLLLWGDLESIAARAGRSIEQLQESLNARNDPDRSQDQDRQVSQEGRANEAQEYSDEEDGPQQKQFRLGSADTNHRFDQDSNQYYDNESSSQRLGQVLQAVVEEVYVESVGVVDSAEAALLDAKREAARITEELLSDITISADTVISMELDALEGDESSEQGRVGAAEGESGSRRRSSSRRRKWRRRQAGEGRAEGATPVSVDDMIGDLVAKHHKAGETEANGPGSSGG